MDLTLESWFNFSTPAVLVAVSAVVGLAFPVSGVSVATVAAIVEMAAVADVLAEPWHPPGRGHGRFQ